MNQAKLKREKDEDGYQQDGEEIKCHAVQKKQHPQ